MKKALIPSLALLFVGLGCLLPTLQAQSPNASSEEGDVVRVTSHPDGTRTIYKRQTGDSGMLSMTYTSNGRLAVVHEYIEGKYAQLVGCNIYDNDYKVIYKVAYGYDRNARLIEERMYSNHDKKLVQRVIYKYDEIGNRSKPIVVSLNVSKHKSPTIIPTMRDDVEKIRREQKRR